MANGYKAPGKAFREGITLMDMMRMFPDEAAATKWFESIVWPEGRCCGKCGSLKTREVPKAKPMPYWCTDCRSYFSVRTGTPMSRSKIPLQKWAVAIYLCITSLKSVSSMKLHRDIGVSQPAAWFMLHRIREAWAGNNDDDYSGPVEVDETYMGGRRRNMSNAKRKALSGRGAAGKTAVVGAKDRASNKVSAEVVASTDAATLVPFVESRASRGATIFTDEAAVYRHLRTMFNDYSHDTVRHSVGEFVRDQVHTNGIESFWSMLKRAHKGTFHKISPKHLNRYVQEFAAKHNMRESDTLVQMRDTVAGLVGHNLFYRDLVADNGLDSAARSA